MTYSNLSNISRIDLNLLVAFQALMIERSVTRAAKSLFLTQSAVSASLRKLRVIFQDELFIRTSHGMNPTDKAVEISPIINEALKSISDLIIRVTQENDFSPESTKETFRIGLTDDVECLLAQKIISEAQKRSLAVNFVFLQTNSHFWLKRFTEDDADLVICSNPKSMSSQYQAADLFSSSYSCVYDNDVYQLKQAMHFEGYVYAPHARVIFDGGRVGFLDEFFEAEGYKRKVKATFFNFSTAINSIIGTDLIVTMPTYGAELFAENNSKIRVNPVPLHLAPSFTVQMIWNVENKQDSRIQWLRNFILEITTDIRTELRVHTQIHP